MEEEGAHHLVAIGKPSAAAQPGMRGAVEGENVDVGIDLIDAPHDLGTAVENEIVVVFSRR